MNLKLSIYFSLALVSICLISFSTLSNFTYDILYTNSLGNVFGDMWNHLRRGSLEASPEIILFEGYFIGEKVYAYPLPMPAFIRGLYSLVSLQDYAIPSFLLAASIWSAAVLGIVINLSKLITPNTSRDWIYPWIPFFLFPILLLMISIKIYWEAAIWGLAIFSAAIWALTNFQLHRSTQSRIVLTVVISLLLFTRPTYTIAGLLVFILLIYLDGKGCISLFDRLRRIVSMKFFIPYLIFVIFVILLGLLNYAKWGNIFDFMPVQFNAGYIASDNNYRAKMALIEPTFKLLRVPESIDYYFGITGANFSSSEPYLVRGKSMLPFQLAYFDYRELYYSISLAMPIYLLFSILGFWVYSKSRNVMHKNHIGTVLVVSLVPGLLLLPLMIVAGRYRAEFYLFIIISGFLFLNWYCPTLSKAKNLILAIFVSLFSFVLIANNVFVERQSFFDCAKGIVPRPLNDFYRCPPLEIEPLSSQNPLYFSKMGLGKYFLIDGWSSPEDWGVWSNGKKSELNLPIRGNETIREIIIRHKKFGPSFPNQQGLEILINGVNQTGFQFNNDSELIRIPFIRNDPFKEEIKLEFRYSNAKSPQELGISQDDRRIAIGLISIELR